MNCKNCKNKAVVELPNSEIKLCRNCYVKYFEKKVYKTITKYNLIGKGDKIGVAVSGGKDSFTLLYILNKIAERKKLIELKVIAIDEGIDKYRNLRNVEKFCRENGIKIELYSFRKEFGKKLDDMLKIYGLKPCSICGVLRRHIMNKKARELGMDKLATGHNLDDEAQSIMMNQLKGNLERSARLGPITGIKRDSMFVPRIKPLYFVSDREVAWYAFIKQLPVDFNECPNKGEAFREDVRNLLNSMELKHKQVKYSIIRSFLDVLPTLRQRYKDREIEKCEKCGEPCSEQPCKVCQLLQKVSSA